MCIPGKAHGISLRFQRSLKENQCRTEEILTQRALQAIHRHHQNRFSTFQRRTHRFNTNTVNYRWHLKSRSCSHNQSQHGTFHRHYPHRSNTNKDKHSHHKASTFHRHLHGFNINQVSHSQCKPLPLLMCRGSSTVICPLSRLKHRSTTTSQESQLPYTQTADSNHHHYPTTRPINSSNLSNLRCLPYKYHKARLDRKNPAA